MSRKWLSIFSDLKGFINNNQQITINQKLIKIPEDDRNEFYGLFDTMRSAFVEEECADLLEWAKPLCERYLQAEQEILKNSTISEVIIPSKLRWFVNNPVDGLRRALYDLLFSLLKDRINIEQFKNQGLNSISLLNNQLKEQCYQYWSMVTLTNLMDPVNYYSVRTEIDISSPESDYAIMPNKQPLEEPKETKKISLVHSNNNIFIVPDIIFYSKIIDQFVALRSEATPATWTAKNASDKMEWLPINHNRFLNPGTVLINTSQNLEAISLIRDAHMISRPDMILVCREPEDWYEKERTIEFSQFKQDLEFLGPRRGMHIISRSVVPLEIRNLISGKTSEPDEKRIFIHNISLSKQRICSLVDILTSPNRATTGSS
jgi:hypothetical protein